MLYMVMNHRQVTDSAYIEYTATVRTDTTGMKPVEPYWMDINDCHVDPFYNIPGTGKPGSTVNNIRDLVMPQDGRIVAGIGHVHGGAKKLTLTQPTCSNRQLADSIPTWGNADHPFYNVRLQLLLLAASGADAPARRRQGEEEVQEEEVQEA